MLEPTLTVRTPPASALLDLLVGDAAGNASPLASSQHGLLCPRFTLKLVENP